MTEKPQISGGSRLMLLVIAMLATASLARIDAPPATRPAKPAGRPGAAAARTAFVVTGSQEVALGQPRVTVQLRSGQRILTGAPPAIPRDLGDLGEDAKPETSFTAFLDTGASGCMLGRATAERFHIERERDAAYHEVGLRGDCAVDVSAPLDLYIRSDQNAAGDEFRRALGNARLQISRDNPSALLQLTGDLNIIGMPVIDELLIEIDPAPLRGQHGVEALLNEGPAVRLLESKERPRNPDIMLPLENFDFSRRKHPDNHGPLPALAANLIVPSVVSARDTKKFTCDWLLDTGAATSIISTRHAKELGLLNADGSPARPPDFALPLAGIGSAESKATPGYIIDSVKLKGRNDRTLEFQKAHVVISDISTTLDDGRSITLDGVLGMNLLLPSASGVDDGKPDQIDDGAFDRIWIDGPRSTLSLKMSKR